MEGNKLYNCNIDEIMDMLDWNNPVEVQEKGIELGSKIRCINVFLQPGHAGHVKNVWDNCAKILYQKSDEELRPYLCEMLEWLEDSNWPGYFTILDRLMKYKDIESLSFDLQEIVKIAKGVNNNMWLLNLADLLEYNSLRECLPDNVIDILESVTIDDL